MAQCITYKCDKCGFSVDSWDDGHPYIRGVRGRRHYFYHPCESQQIQAIIEKIIGHIPSPEEQDEYLRSHSGNAADYICYDCGKKSKIDPERDKKNCRKCGSLRIVCTDTLGGKRCIKCEGHFSEGEVTGIS